MRSVYLARYLGGSAQIIARIGNSELQLKLQVLRPAGTLLHPNRPHLLRTHTCIKFYCTSDHTITDDCYVPHSYRPNGPPRPRLLRRHAPRPRQHRAPQFHREEAQRRTSQFEGVRTARDDAVLLQPTFRAGSTAGSDCLSASCAAVSTVSGRDVAILELVANCFW